VNQDTDRLELETNAQGSGYIFITKLVELFCCETIVQIRDQSVSFCKFTIFERFGKFQYCRTPDLFSVLIELHQSKRNTKNNRQGSKYFSNVCQIRKTHRYEST